VEQKKRKRSDKYYSQKLPEASQKFPETSLGSFPGTSEFFILCFRVRAHEKNCMCVPLRPQPPRSATAFLAARSGAPGATERAAFPRNPPFPKALASSQRPNAVGGRRCCGLLKIRSNLESPAYGLRHRRGGLQY
jgi:hypothetical protein